jgi:hypothetical protein
MRWLDPHECVLARHYLQHGNARAAAQVLLGSPQAAHRAVWELLQECHRRLVAEAETAFEGGAFAAAQELWNLAAKCTPPQGRTLVLGQRIEEGICKRRPTPPANNGKRSLVNPHETKPLTDREMRFALGQRALVISQPEISLGLAGGPATIPIRGPLHRQHALLTRKQNQYWLAPHPGHRDAVAINSRILTTDQPLVDGDVLEMGKAGLSRSCRWRFRMPLRESGTAILEMERGRVLTPSGGEFDRVVLMDDDLVIRPGPPAHCVWADLPVDVLRFSWTSSGLILETQGGFRFVEHFLEGLEPPPEPLGLPCRLQLLPESDLGDQILGLFAGDPKANGLMLELTNPFAPVS